MKRTAGLKINAGFLNFYVAGDNVNDAEAVFYF